MNPMRYIKAMLTFARHQAWVDQPEWKREHAFSLGRYLASPGGQVFRAALLNMNLRQQAGILGRTENLEFEVGYATGQAAAIAAITALADEAQFTEDGEHDADQPTN